MSKVLTATRCNALPTIKAKPALRNEPTIHLVGKDYSNLCAVCQAAIDLAASLLPELPDEYADDLEGPIMWACDNRLMCGGGHCTNRKTLTEVQAMSEVGDGLQA